MKEEKEIIEEIVDRLKSSDDYMYKEGAWEKFQSYEKSSSPVFIRIQKYLSAAVVLLIGAVAIYYYSISNEGQLNNIDVQDTYVKVPKQADDSKVNNSEAPLVVNDGVFNNTIVSSTNNLHQASTEKIAVLESNILGELDHTPTLDIAISGAKNDLKSIVLNPIKPATYDGAQSSQELRNHLIAANTSLGKRVLSNNQMDHVVSPKFFQFADKFELGLFISPFTNAENLKVGAGLSLSYNVSKKISLRTGASFNNYEVGILKNPLDDNSIEQVVVSVDNSALNSPGSASLNMEISRVSLPNINAVTGFVQSIEVPLEVQYKLNKSFYAVAGLSYSTIISQERNAHYIENVNTSVYTIDKQSMQSVTPVRKTIKSAKENVNPNTYSGFVNLSVGKKVNVNHKFGVSVEPYYKIPLGGFRKADMNYSNAGVRIMTNF